MAEARKGDGRKGDLTPEFFAHRVVIWWLPLLYFLISSLFYLRTYDSAQVKITVMQMGGLALLTLWLSRLIDSGVEAFSKDDLVCLSPFLAYLAVGVISYIRAPYNMASTDFFLRHFFFMTVALIVIYEFDSDASDRLTRVLIWTGWVAIGYGFLQFIDGRAFPPGIGRGADPFIWRGAFGQRVFSTYGNPNFFADFLVILFPILLTQYLKTRQTSLLPLMFMLLVDLVMTGTKGAWIGFAMVVFLLGVIAFVFFPQQSRPYRAWILGLVAAGVFGFAGLLAKDLSARIVSVNFRLFTWEATWEMIRSSPLLGSGTGAFPPLYPAFRRPPIFHIEGKHNTETDHAENEYLEQFLDHGIVGFGIFIWLVFSTLFVGFRSLRQLVDLMGGREARPPPRAYDLIGYMVAFMGMLGHNFFDVSLRFVSSGVYLGLLSGMIVNLARGKGLYELHGLREQRPVAMPERNLSPQEERATPLWKVVAELLIWPARAAAWGGLVYAAYLILTEFHRLQGPVGGLRLGGEVLQWYLAWGTMLACVGSLTFVFIRLVQLADNPLIPLVIVAALNPLYTCWGFFKADMHHNLAIALSKEKRWDMALANYLQVRRLNPDFVMAAYFMGNVFNDRFNMNPVYNPGWGDTNNVPRDDYQRALDSYNEVRRISPNYVQHHHQVGALHMKRAEWAVNNGRPQEAGPFLELAVNRLKLYEQIDPVFAPNYFRLGQIYMVTKRYAEAAKVYEALIKAEKCQVDEPLISNPRLKNTILAYQTYVNEPGTPHPVHRHESPEAYTSLANAQYMLDRLDLAEQNYKKALSLDPNFDQAKKNLSVAYQKAQSQGRLQKLLIPEGSTSAPVGPYTGYEIRAKK